MDCKIRREQVGILIQLASQEDGAQYNRTKKTQHHITSIPPGDTGARKTCGYTTCQQDERVDQGKDDIQVISRGQLECKGPAHIPDFKVKIRRDQVGEDQRLRGNEEDHPPPAKTSPRQLMLSSSSDWLTLSSTHLFSSPYLEDRYLAPLTGVWRHPSLFPSFKPPTNDGSNR